MADMIYCEFLKLKRSKVCMAAVLGTFATPLLAVTNSIRSHFTYGGAVSLFAVYDTAFMFLMLLFGPLIFSIIASYLFSREYTEKTLKTIFVVPISKKKFVSGKFITLFICTLILMLISWAEIFVLGGICEIVWGTGKIDFSAAVYFLIKIIQGAVLLYFTITPFAFLAMYARGFIIPMIAAAIIALGNVVLSGSSIAGFVPWSASYLIVRRINQSACPAFVSMIIILVLFLLSYICSILLFEKEDVA